jgi:hypothetical protein
LAIPRRIGTAQERFVALFVTAWNVFEIWAFAGASFANWAHFFQRMTRNPLSQLEPEVAYQISIQPLVGA